MADMEKLVRAGFDYAKEVYASKGVDVESAMEKAAKTAISLHCWQGDDVVGFEGGGGASGGIATTGNYPGRARTADELRADLDFAMPMIPGKSKLNLHASYAELNGKKLDRDEYSIAEFQGWVDWAKSKKIGLDFNPTYFSHPFAEDGFTLASRNETHRKFWIEHGKRCREIGEEFGKQLGIPCVINFWMPDGYKDNVEDSATPRMLMLDSLDQIFAAKQISGELVKDAVESKLFGLGVEAYTVGSSELMLGYAITRKKLLCLDAGHFHPTEKISQKISACMQYLDEMLLHVSRPMRWDSDHVVTLDDELQDIMNEIVKNGYQDRVNIALDFFDASINRVAAWIIGTRNAQKALLKAYLSPTAPIKAAEVAQDYTSRLALQEEAKTLPFTAIWDMYCQKQGAPVGDHWLTLVKQYEKDVLSKR
jgi:L-rhamnose isomerase